MADANRRRTLFLGTTNRGETPTNLVHFQRIDKSPWTDYEPVLRQAEGETVTVAVNTKSTKTVAIREIKSLPKTILRNLRPVVHNHVVPCQCAYYHEGSIYLIYEHMGMPLHDIIETPRGRIDIQDVATIAAAVLRGLQFVHEELDIAYGSLDAFNIMLNTSGQVKLANVAEYLIRYEANPEKQDDIANLGRIVRDLLEPDTAIRNPNSLTLQRLSRAAPQAFLDSTKSGSLSTILQHPFLQISRGQHHLIPYILVASQVVVRDVEVLPAVKIF